MRLHSLVCLLFVLVVVLDSVTSYPAADPDDKDFRPSLKKHSKLSKKHRSNHHHRHSSRGLKEAADYDAGLSPQSTFPAANVQREPKSPGDAKYRKIPLVKQDRQRSKKRQGKSKRRKNKRSGSSRGNKSNKDFERKMAASLRTARRADPDGPLYDATLDDDATSKQQLLGLGVFGDMRKFFHELRTNLDTDADAASAIGESDRVKAQDPSVSSVNDPGFEEYEELPNYQALRTMGSDGYAGAGLTAPDREHQQRRQSRLRGFVSMAGAGWPSEPSRHHRARQYDPALLWTGLGR